MLDEFTLIMASATATIELVASGHSNHSACLRFRKYFHLHVRFLSIVVKDEHAQIQQKRFSSIDTNNNNNRGFTSNMNIKAHVSLLEVCTDVKVLRQHHAQMLISGFDKNIHLDSRLVTMYSKCRSLIDARLAFDQIYQPTTSLWNIMIKEYATKGFCNEALALYCEMQDAGIQPDNYTFPFVLRACAGLSTLQAGKVIHYHIIRAGLEEDVFLGNALINMYVKCGSLEDARQLFDEMSERDVVSWTLLIAGYTQIEHADEALALFHQMQLANVMPDSVTVVSVLSASAYFGDIEQGKQIHAYITKSGVDSDVFVETALLDMYAKFGSIDIANQFFEKISKKDVVTWNAMLAGYAKSGHANEALMLFNQMQLMEATPSSVTMVNVLSACAHLGALHQGTWVHSYIIKRGFESDIVVGTALIDMYAKCRTIDVAQQLFEMMSIRNVVSWSAMITGYAQNEHANDALVLFNEMQLADVKPNSVTMVSVLSACAQLAAPQQSKWIHGYIIRCGFQSDLSVENSLLDMYAKCGRIDIARKLFDKMSKRDVISWNAMITGYGMHGHGKDALALFNQMQERTIKPNHITFVSILSACSHAGLVELGWQYFNCMSREYHIIPNTKHYACMVDLLGRAGQLDEAHELIKGMPLESDVGVWGALLGACRIHSNTQLGEYVAKQLYDLEPENAGYYILISNIYAAAGRWDDAAKVRDLMNAKGLKKTPGYSLIEVNNKVHTFLVGDRSHPQSETIYGMLESLAGQMEEAGYVPDTNFVLHDVEEEVKEHMLYSHSEKLAIAFGIINTSPGTPIQITKNLRVCGDCHSATKFISKIVQREIIMRDANRFHHFKDGFCSCRDYW